MLISAIWRYFAVAEAQIASDGYLLEGAATDAPDGLSVAANTISQDASARMQALASSVLLIGRAWAHQGSQQVLGSLCR